MKERYFFQLASGSWEQCMETAPRVVSPAAGTRPLVVMALGPPYEWSVVSERVYARWGDCRSPIEGQVGSAAGGVGDRLVAVGSDDDGVGVAGAAQAEDVD